jgi:transposase
MRYRIALTRMRHEPRTRDYVERRTAKNRSNKDILRCLKRAIAREIYHVLLNPTRAASTNLRALRLAKNLTLTQADEALHTWPTHLSDIEQHARPLPDLTDRYGDWLTAA